jgi:hypothetical protein
VTLTSVTPREAAEILQLLQRIDAEQKDPTRAYEHAHILSDHFDGGSATVESRELGDMYTDLWSATAVLTGRITRLPNGELTDYIVHPELPEWDGAIDE